MCGCALDPHEANQTPELVLDNWLRHFLALATEANVVGTIADAAQDMDALVCRRTLTGHRNDVLSITGLDLTASHSDAEAAVEASALLLNGQQAGDSSTSLDEVRGEAIAYTHFQGGKFGCYRST